MISSTHCLGPVAAHKGSGTQQIELASFMAKLKENEEEKESRIPVELHPNDLKTAIRPHPSKAFAVLTRAPGEPVFTACTLGDTDDPSNSQGSQILLQYNNTHPDEKLTLQHFS